MTILPLEWEHVPVLLPGARAFFAEGAIPGQLNEGHFVATIRGMITGGMGFVLIAHDADRGIVGAIGGACVRDFATGDLTATELFWFSLPTDRVAGVRLLKAFEAEALRRGCARIHMVHLANHCSEKLDRFYERAGYRYLEKAFTKELLPINDK